MLKIYKKPEPLKFWYPTLELERHIFIYGKIGCLDENSEIYIFDNKLKKVNIKDLPNNFKVLSYNFKKRQKEIQNAIKIDSGEKDCYEIILDNNKKIIATSEHRFFNKEEKEIEVKNLKKGDKLLCFSGKNLFKQNSKIYKMKILKIKLIKYIGKRKTYDLIVENNHNYFLTNGVLTHNSGKSCSLMTISQSYKDNYNYKIWDLYGGNRNENTYWCIPNQDIKFWDKLTNFGKLNESGPKQYYINLYYPYFSSTIPKKLPQKLPFIKSKLFTIPLKDIEIEDISLVINNVSEQSEYYWYEILNKSTKKDNCAGLDFLSNEVKSKNSILYRRFIVDMIKEKLLMDSYCDYNIDLLSEARDKEGVFVLCLDFVPKRYRLFIINYILRKLNNLIDENKIKKKNLFLIREAADFFKATDDSILEDKYKRFRRVLSQYIREGRRGMNFVLDCQSSSETKGLVQGQEDFIILFKLTASADKDFVTDELKREKRMRNDQIGDLAFLEAGECYIAETDKIVRKIKFSFPRTMYWKKNYGEFYNDVWEKYGGEWKNVDEISDYVDERYNNNFKKWELVKEELLKKHREKLKKKNISKTIDKQLQQLQKTQDTTSIEYETTDKIEKNYEFEEDEIDDIYEEDVENDEVK